MENKTKVAGIEPLVFEDSQILILGSFPSVKSRQNNFYYANPRNKLWKLLASFFNEEVPQSVEEKIDFCRKHKIALWDVVTSSNLKGSSDVNLKKSNYDVADIPGLLNTHPDIKVILCNGKLAYNLFTKHFNVALPVYYAPSTSPANTRFDIDAWRKHF